VGERRLADQVLYHIVDYATAPVPDCIVLGVWRAPGDLPREVKGIDVGRKGELLFFLHTANVHNPIAPEERERLAGGALPEVLRYVIHYADGQSVEIPVLLEKNIDHWLQYQPEPLPGAQVAATVDVPGLANESSEGLQRLLYQMNAHRIGYANLPAPAADEIRGVVYSMQVKNPRPDVEIESIDVVPGNDDRRAVPAVLGITLGDVVAGG
jgi:hypothetical protein